MNDIPQKITATANAALFYQADAYDSQRKKVMGRNVAGATFLEAFLRYADVDHWYAVVDNRSGADDFKTHVKAICDAHSLPEMPASVSRGLNPELLTEAGCYFLPDPGISRLSWPRRSFNQRAFSLCGITHTIASENVMDQLAKTLLAPLQSWDAVICTSISVKQAIEQFYEGYGEFTQARVGARFPIPMQLPIIPLGTDGDLGDQRHKNAAGREALRAQYGIAEDDVVVMFFGRLSFHAKAHPAPMMAAVEDAAKHLPNTKLHLFMVGQFFNDGIEHTFRDLGAKICHLSSCHFLDGADPAVAEASWAASDIFLSLSDNIQESFGLTPLEAMAAGLPCVVSDWDGYKDTVIEGETGFRIPSLLPDRGAGAAIADAFGSGVLNYDRYIAATSQATAVDIPAASAAIVKLADNADLRHSMAAAGKRHIARTLDWAQIIPQYQALWQELAERRATDIESVPRGPNESRDPSRPDPFEMFKNHATHVLAPDDIISQGSTRYVPIDELLSETAYNLSKGLFFVGTELTQILTKIDEGPTSVADICALLPAAPATRVARGLAWLYKFGVITIVKS
jgi:glycosyltransferase involved in cell wall biosynthesis